MQLEKREAFEENYHLNDIIMNFIKSKGTMQTTIFSKLTNYIFKHLGLGKRITRGELVKELMSLIKNEKIEIFIPSPIEPVWLEKYQCGFKYLCEGPYICREYRKYRKVANFHNSSRQNGFIFDSRNLVNNKVKMLEETLYKDSSIDPFVMIQNKESEIPVEIYKSHSLKNIGIDNQVNRPLFYKKKDMKKINIPLNLQKTNLSVLKRFRSTQMCFFVSLLDVIYHYITHYPHTISEKKMLEKRFGYYSNEFAKSDWIDIKEGNPYRWDTFFRHFDLPIFLERVAIENIRFEGKCFELEFNLVFYLEIDKKEVGIIESLEKVGFHRMKMENGQTARIGMNLDIYSISPAVEYNFFLIKYAVFYHLFYLFSLVCDPLLNEKGSHRFTIHEKNIYEVFLPVLQRFFDIEEDAVKNKLIFQFLTYDSEELEAIYSGLLMGEVKKIEKKLFNYFLLRTSKNK